MNKRSCPCPDRLHLKISHPTRHRKSCSVSAYSQEYILTQEVNKLDIQKCQELRKFYIMIPMVTKVMCKDFCHHSILIQKGWAFFLITNFVILDIINGYLDLSCSVIFCIYKPTHCIVTMKIKYYLPTENLKLFLLAWLRSVLNAITK